MSLPPSAPKKASLSKQKMSSALTHDPLYQQFLLQTKEKIRAAQIKAALAVNQHMLLFYWELGQMMLQQQQAAKWGDKWVEQLSADLINDFPDQSGFSRTNLLYMRKFAETYPTIQIVQQVVGQLPWGQNIVLLSISDTVERAWYAYKAAEEGWIRKDLVQAIQNNLYHTQGKLEHKTSNFEHRLLAPQSAQAHEILKDPYKLHFLTLGKDAEEKDIELGLIDHITHFLLELGQGFSFCGRQQALKISDKTYRLDLLFYHYKLHCFVVIEIKRGIFKPEHAGQLNFYLSAVDELFKGEHDNPSIGILFCEKKDRVVAEYALRDLNKPIGISEYELSKALPPEVRNYLPTVEELEEELNQELYLLNQNNSLQEGHK